MTVSFEHFSYAYPHSGVVLDDISLSIPKGAFTVITGPSGAGKTSLALAIAGVVPHYFGGRQGGTVRVGNIISAQSSMGELAEHVGTVLADYESQLVALTAAEEVAFGLETSGLSRSQIAGRVKEALAMVGLDGMEEREVAGLSGGQKQRLAIASVLVTSPEILVLDEPASALDPEGAAGIYELLYELNCQGKTIIVVEHQLARILPYASQVVVLQAGSLVFAGDLGQTMAFMWQKPELRLGVPPLWTIKLMLEEQTGLTLAAWKNESQAAEELNRLTGACVKGVAKSA
ncbi:energy-coupling factor ABC transporter ATP-binding protein [Sporomusa acidovorans]|uniref:Energy-coupling factor transporter ATP-binding protein EcfA2 n=1 Tax=Sporomusa acidovorans (strain ATCC 49682 / DSM 3132 / Mol) TaxID=1123286 RepID=A0ABZ3IVL6_SPOA4|nr:ABC transporter ATP-binding protein [Sporomusa acidovorans]OZC15285.1 energy-coupling factor transporter ATP-binding protein EcfA2 [Sporomusa acidovorans DSM 3132]SDE92062.1 energy-coupling factor transport system ATP-binding protein [Sporomusa acidovorans]